MTILVVEDNPVNAEMIRLALEREQYVVVLAEDGAAALAELEAHPEIDLVITDVMMPNVDGLQMLERVRQRPEWRMLPVVVATSVANQATVRQAVSLHCKHFIVKPFTVQLLLQTVRDAIGLRGVVLQDRARVQHRLGLDPEGYDRLTLTFANVVHARVTALRDLAERTEQEGIDPAHRREFCALEESAALLGAERLANTLNAFGLPNGPIPSEDLGAAYKALLTELQLLATALPAPKKKRKRLVDDNPLDGSGDAEAEDEDVEGEESAAAPAD